MAAASSKGCWATSPSTWNPIGTRPITRYLFATTSPSSSTSWLILLTVRMPRMDGSLVTNMTSTSRVV